MLTINMLKTIASVGFITFFITKCQGASLPILSQQTGVQTEPNEFLEFTSVHRVNSGDHLCGGVLIDADSLLTVASCLYDPSGRPFNIDELRVTIGADTQREVKRIFIHPDYQFSKESSNIALLHLNTIQLPVAAVANPPVTTNTAIEPLTPNQKCTLVGWAATAADGATQAPLKRKMDIKFESNNIFVPLAGDSAECKPTVGAAVICNGMLNGFLNVVCPSTVNFVDVTTFNVWIDQIWRCELKPETGGCLDKPAVMAVAENINIGGGASESVTVEYNEQMDRAVHDVLITTVDAMHGANGPTSAPEPAPEPVNDDMAEVGHVYHDHHGGNDNHDDHDHMHDHYEQNSRTHESYEQNSHNHNENYERPSQEQQEGRAPSTSGVAVVFQSLSLMICTVVISSLPISRVSII